MEKIIILSGIQSVLTNTVEKIKEYKEDAKLERHALRVVLILGLTEFISKLSIFQN